MTRGLAVGAGGDPPSRGGEVEALVTVSDPGRLGELEVGLVCTEYYDETETTTDSRGRVTQTRTTSEATAYEAWLPVESFTGVHTARVPIPADAPFSYEGSCLSFKWELVARGRRRRRLDTQARHDLLVLP